VRSRPAPDPVTDRPSWVDVQPGDVLVGKYRVERILSAGGLGVVVAANDLAKNAKVALKFFLPDPLARPDAAKRFLREAHAATRIESEHVARIIDAGTLPNGFPFTVTEYLEGGDLAAWLRERGPLTTELAVDFVLQTCVALADALRIGMGHRHLKPAKLFCVRRPDGQLHIKVLDFGMSALAQEAPAGRAIRPGTPRASLSYMAPEQLLSAPAVDARTDIWALGVVLWELVTGRAPFGAPTLTELTIKVTTEPVGSMRSLRPDVPERLDAVVATCLQKTRDRRFASVADLASALLPLAPDRAKALVDHVIEVTKLAIPSASASQPPPDARTVAEARYRAAELTSRRSHRSGVLRRRWTLAVVLALGALGLIAFATTRGRREPTDMAASSPSESAPSSLDGAPFPDASVSRASTTTPP
jgi:serine/threonine protein kinase